MPVPSPVFLIDGRYVYKTSNALKITFSDGPGSGPLGALEQGASDGKRKRFATLLATAQRGASSAVASPGGGVVFTARGAEEAKTPELWWDHAGQALPIRILGARIVGYRAVSELVRNLLMAVCVDITIGLRPYISEMQ